jgi:hypothetical protein
MESKTTLFPSELLGSDVGADPASLDSSDPFHQFRCRQSKLCSDLLEQTRLCTTFRERLQVKELEAARLLNDCDTAEAKVECLLQEKNRDALRFEQDYAHQLQIEIKQVEEKHAEEVTRFEADTHRINQLHERERDILMKKNQALQHEVEASMEKSSKLSTTQQRQLQSYQGGMSVAILYCSCFFVWIGPFTAVTLIVVPFSLSHGRRIACIRSPGGIDQEACRKKWMRGSGQEMECENGVDGGGTRRIRDRTCTPSQRKRLLTGECRPFSFQK